MHQCEKVVGVKRVEGRTKMTWGNRDMVLDTAKWA